MKVLENCLDLKHTQNKGLFYVKGSGSRVKIPSLDKNLALFLGILWGDGWLASRKVAIKNYSWRVGIVEDDKPLIYEFIELTDKIFGVRPKINDRKTKLEAYFSNRIIYEILNRVYNFPDGYKINRLRIPKVIFNSKELMSAFLSGVFSTDGKFTVYKNYPRLCVESASLEFTEDMKLGLINLGFNAKLYTWNRKEGNKLFGLYLNGLNQVKKFQSEIGFIGEKANKLEHFLTKQPR